MAVAEQTALKGDDLIRSITQEYLRESTPDFAIGDTVDVHVSIREGEKQRVQVFNGTVIRRKGSGIGETFTVRRIVSGQGVERIFPLHSPNVVDVVVQKRGRVRRAKLYYLRKRVGKGTRVREKIWIKPSKDKADKPAESQAPEMSAEDRAKAAAEAEASRKAEKKKAEKDRKARKNDRKAKRREAKKKKKQPEKKAEE